MLSSKSTGQAAEFASCVAGGYYRSSMPASRCKRYLWLFAILMFAMALPTMASDAPAILPLRDVKPGMMGVAYTIYQGDQIQKVNLEVIGTLKNALGPKQSIILVRLLGNEAAQSGVVAGMSGSPVYFNGKLAGALSLKLGTFTKQAIAGVTPIAAMMKVEGFPSSPAPAASGRTVREALNTWHVPVPGNLGLRVSAGSGGFLVPIETPLVATGLHPETLARFGKDFSSWGMAVTMGGTAPASSRDSSLKPGDMVGIDLIRGDLSLSSGCTVTLIQSDHILACGHPLFGFGNVSLPLSRAHVLMTLASAANSTKIITTGGVIGTLTQDRQSAVSGVLGAGPPMIPLDMTLSTPDGQSSYHFQVAENPDLTSILVATAAYNSIVGSPIYGQGMTLQLDGSIDVKGYTPVRLADLFAPIQPAVPTGFSLALSVQSAFARIYSNPYELPHIERVDLHIKAMPERRWAVIDDAWPEMSQVHPGETVKVKVLLRPYRGAPFVQEIPITIPPQASRGKLELLVSDAAFLNRNVRMLALTSEGQLPGLQELINLINRERHNDRLYATLLQPTPSMLVEDKEMPNVPVSMIDVLDGRRNSGSARLLRQSTVGEWSVAMHEVIAGERMLTITVK